MYGSDGDKIYVVEYPLLQQLDDQNRKEKESGTSTGKKDTDTVNVASGLERLAEDRKLKIARKKKKANVTILKQKPHLPLLELSDRENAAGLVFRKCVICLEMKLTEDIFDESSKTDCRPQIRFLLNHLVEILPIIKESHIESGICPSCMDNLQRWHVFKSDVVNRHRQGGNRADSTRTANDSIPIPPSHFETQVYKHPEEMKKAMAVYETSAHTHFTKRHLTYADWDYFCEQLHSIATSEESRKQKVQDELELYLTSKEKLSKIFCNSDNCEAMVNNGKEGFRRHLYFAHPKRWDIPCDICGLYFPIKGNFEGIDDKTRKDEDYYFSHWISHFLFIGQRIEYQKRASEKNLIATGKAATTVQQVQAKPNTDLMTGKNFVCKVCNKGFKTMRGMTDHETIHTGEMPYSCASCGKKFRVKSSQYYTHMKAHRTQEEQAKANQKNPEQVKPESASSAASMDNSTCEVATENPVEESNDVRNTVTVALPPPIPMETSTGNEQEVNICLDMAKETQSTNKKEAVTPSSASSSIDSPQLGQTKLVCFDVKVILSDSFNRDENGAPPQSPTVQLLMDSNDILLQCTPDQQHKRLQSVASFAASRGQNLMYASTLNWSQGQVRLSVAFANSNIPLVVSFYGM